MWNTKRIIGVAIALMIVAVVGWSRFGEKSSSPLAQPNIADQVPPSPKTVVIAPKALNDNSPEHRLSKPIKLSSSERETMQAVLRAAQEQRVASEPLPENPLPGPGKSSSHDGDSSYALNIKNKTDSDTDWDRKQIEVLNQLLGECYDLAKEEEPDLYGAIGLRFTLHAEPEIGGLVEGIEFMTEYSTIENTGMRECMRESLYALELTPPEEGVEVARQITLRFDEE